MALSFSDFYKRACEASGADTQMKLASILGVNRSAITQAKRRNAVPQKWLLHISRKFAVSPDWLEFGGPSTIKYLASYTQEESPALNLAEPESYSVPKISAILCAGAGSLQADTTVVDYMPLPADIVKRLFVNRKDLVLMDVSGDSMEPGIMHGDTVLIDQSSKALHSESVYAVGYEDSIYIKRVLVRDDACIVLLSDNHKYSPLYIHEQELDTFRVIGKLVWLCRDIK